MRKLFSMLLAILALLSIASPALACDPPPPTTSKYVDCDDLGDGYQMGFRVTGARNGTYRLSSRYGTRMGGAPEDTRNTVTIASSNGRVFAWDASLGIDAVIVNAGGRSAVKTYSESYSDVNVYGRIGSDGRPSKVESVIFCYDYELSGSASAYGTYTSAGEWGITKTVDLPAQTRFAGETAPFQYTVAVDNSATGEASGGEVITYITITNDTPLLATIRSIRNQLPQANVWAAVDCGRITFPYRMRPWSELHCTATAAVDSRRDEVSVVTFDAYGLRGATENAPIEWTGDTDEGNPAGPATVTDTNAAFGGPYTVTTDSSWTYTVNLDCPTDPALYVNGVYTRTLDNTAAIANTELQASRSVQLSCYAPTISATGASSYDVTYVWGITKTSPTTSLTLRQNETANVGYNVVVSVVDRVESNVRVNGNVVVQNPNPAAPMTVTLVDPTTNSFPAGLTGCANPLTIPAGQSVTCPYAADQQQGVAIQVLMNNIAFGRVSLDSFANAPAHEYDRCVTVRDEAFEEPLGVTCANQAPATYNYQVAVGPYPDCGFTSYLNTATFETDYNHLFGFANWDIPIRVRCTEQRNCTYNAATWIAYANPDPSTYDTTWDTVGGPNAPFFGTGLTWLQMLSDPSTRVYETLAREYIVGRLNVNRGAQATPQFVATLDYTAQLLATYAATRDSITDTNVVADFNHQYSLIKNFNDGLTGPGLCPDCTFP